ncbi:hypothetical protein Cde04nite_32520 [Cellulomonas denverensis]|uniref:IS3 family transposase n=1 Tax=Cellulomonas denverensis TaxID=264297 RepID=A0A7X6KSL1_9CELL|nr:IS3 family transposase [Cellulomonas denverensis]GIG27008.1 hypothetical protein Cde04nite_32520 [Cellulomonas denverensis]
MGVSKPGYYRYRTRATSQTQLRRQWLTELIREVHVASRGTYGYRRVRAKLTTAKDVTVSSMLVFALTRGAGIYGLPGQARLQRQRAVTAGDLVNDKFHRLCPNELWVTDITEHHIREVKLHCCVLDAFSCTIIGWSIDSTQDTRLVINALDMAIRNSRRPAGDPGQPQALGDAASWRSTWWRGCPTSGGVKTDRWPSGPSLRGVSMSRTRRTARGIDAA